MAFWCQNTFNESLKSSNLSPKITSRSLNVNLSFFLPEWHSLFRIFIGLKLVTFFELLTFYLSILDQSLGTSKIQASQKYQRNFLSSNFLDRYLQFCFYLLRPIDKKNSSFLKIVFKILARLTPCSLCSGFVFLHLFFISMK